jgi:uncharacterized membrane protein
MRAVIEIDAPPAEVWAVLVDVERWPAWTPTMSRVERLDPGSFVVGRRVRIRQPRLPVVVWTVSTLERNRFFEWQNVAVGLKSVAGHRVESNGRGGARVTLSFEWSGWLTPLIRLLYGKLTHRYVNTEAESLKRLCETAARRAVPAY